MRIELVSEAKKVLLMSWSARFGMLAAVLQTLAEFQDQLPYVKDFIPANVFSLLAIMCAIAVPLSRVIKQKNLVAAVTDAAADPTPAGVAAAVAEVAAPVLVPVAPDTPPPATPGTAPAVVETRPAPPALVTK